MQSTEHIKNTLPFSGVNVILCGDFHQFPPVTGGKYAALYYPNSTATMNQQYWPTSLWTVRTVVILSAQVRVTDIVWRDFLRNLQWGMVTNMTWKWLKHCVWTGRHSPTRFFPATWNHAVWWHLDMLSGIGLLTSIRYTHVLESGTRGKTRETRTRGYQVPGSWKPKESRYQFWKTQVPVTGTCVF